MMWGWEASGSSRMPSVGLKYLLGLSRRPPGMAQIHSVKSGACMLRACMQLPGCALYTCHELKHQNLSFCAGG